MTDPKLEEVTSLNTQFYLETQDLPLLSRQRNGHPNKVGTNYPLRNIDVDSKRQAHQGQVFPVTLFLWPQTLLHRLSKLVEPQKTGY